MVNWDYNPDDYNADGYGLIPEGEYRVRIEKCEQILTRTGKDMFKLTLKVSGYNSNVWYYMVFDNTDEEARKRTNQRLGNIYDSFNIPKGNTEPADWQGKTGGVKIKHRLYDEEMRAEAHYFLKRGKVDKLPEWQEGFTKKTANSMTTSDIGFNSQNFDEEAED